MTVARSATRRTSSTAWSVRAGNRLFHIYDAFKLGIPFNTIQKLTKIDPWFLRQVEELIQLEKQIEQYRIEDPARVVHGGQRRKAMPTGRSPTWCVAWRARYSVVARSWASTAWKLVDTCAAEFEARTPYYYSTFDEENESVVSDKKKIVILGSGPKPDRRGIEFDYSCVHGVLAAKECGYETIMINCNPETVSTDFDIADKLYFEPVFWEHIYEILLHEKPEGVIVQLGGQTALKLAEKLNKHGFPHHRDQLRSLDLAEDCGRFLTLCAT